MELIQEDGKYFIKADVTELVKQVKAIVSAISVPGSELSHSDPLSPFYNPDLYGWDDGGVEKAREAKIEAERLAAEVAEEEQLRIEAEAEAVAEAEIAKAKLAAWQLKYPNMRRSETKPTEDPGEGWEWTNKGICKNCWTRTKTGR